MKLTKILKTTMTLMALTLLMIMCCFAITVSAEETAEPNESSKVLLMENYCTYEIYPDGYKVGYSGIIEHTGTYVLTGSASEDIVFKSNGTPVTYNVIFHGLNAVSDEWYGMINIDYDVTLNITVYGENSVIAHNHPGFRIGNGDGENAPVVNITMTENSILTVGSAYYEIEESFNEEIVVNLNAEASSSLDMSVEGWQNNRKIEFTNGTEWRHKTGFVYVDDDICGYRCSDCELVNMDRHHEKYLVAHETDHENYSTKHREVCGVCMHVFGESDHTKKYDTEENYHTEICEYCYYSGEHIEHTPGDDGCTECGLKYAFKHEANGETEYIFFINKAAELVEEKGGKLTALMDIEEIFGATIYVSNHDAIIDLAGKKLTGVSLSVASGKTLTVIDSSESKSGVLEKDPYNSSYVNGTLIIDGITLNQFHVVAYSDSTITVKNTVCKENLSFYLYEESSVELTNVTCEEGFKAQFDAQGENVTVNISNSTFAKLTVEAYSYEAANVNMLLPEGYAFAGADGILDGSGTEITNVTAIVEHTEHNIDKQQNNSKEHWMSCSCGNSENSVSEPHTLDDDGFCPTCKVQITAKLVVGDETMYYANTVDALSAANSYEAATVILVADFEYRGNNEIEVRNTLTLELNGYKLITRGRINVYNSLTVNDSSVGKTGEIRASSDISYIIEFHSDSNVVINGGRFFGLIYGALYDSEKANLTINGGRFLGSEKFRLNAGTTVTINGGVFECSESVFNFVWSTRVNYVINGGVFINSTVFYVADEYRLDSLADVLGTKDGCELCFVNARGELLTLEDVCSYYDGEIYVFHKGAEIVYNDSTHKLYCEGCEEYSAEIEHTRTYEASDSDNSAHNVICEECCSNIGAEQHTGGEATCTDKAECEICFTLYGEEPQGHIYDNACDTACNECQSEREVPDHVYDNACDTACNECELGREVPDHVYDNACDTACNECQSEREVPDHVYDNACDTACNECQSEREVPDHVYDNDCDTACNECEYLREIAHDYGADGNCTVCGAENPNKPTTDSSTVDSNEPTTDSSTVDSNEPTTDSSTVDSNEPTTDSSTVDSNEPTTGSTAASTTDSSATTDTSGSSTTVDTPPPSAPENTADEGLGTGAIVGIVLGSVAAVGAAGAITFIIIRKKKLTDI